MNHITSHTVINDYIIHTQLFTVILITIKKIELKSDSKCFYFCAEMLMKYSARSAIVNSRVIPDPG